jgi:sugar phosphate isomerase/epimerase
MSAPRIAFSTLAFPNASLATAISLGRSWGYSGVELRLIDGDLIDPAMTAADRARVKAAAVAAGLPIVAVDSSVRLTDDEPGAELARFIELASDWESPLVRVFGGPLPDGGPDRQTRLAVAAQVLEASVPLAEQLGVAIGVETHDSFSASSVVAELLAMIPSPVVGAIWDSHHPCRMGQGPAEVWSDLGRRMLLAQVKDARRDTGRPDGWQLVLLGHGEVPVREMVELLHDDGYEGWISVEWEKRWHPEIEEPEVALPQHMAVLRTWLTEVEAGS